MKFNFKILSYLLLITFTTANVAHAKESGRRLMDRENFAELTDLEKNKLAFEFSYHGAANSQPGGLLNHTLQQNISDFFNSQSGLKMKSGGGGYVFDENYNSLSTRSKDRVYQALKTLKSGSSVSSAEFAIDGAALAGSLACGPGAPVCIAAVEGGSLVAKFVVDKYEDHKSIIDKIEGGNLNLAEGVYSVELSNFLIAYRDLDPDGYSKNVKPLLNEMGVSGDPSEWLNNPNFRNYLQNRQEFQNAQNERGKMAAAQKVMSKDVKGLLESQKQKVAHALSAEAYNRALMDEQAKLFFTSMLFDQFGMKQLGNVTKVIQNQWGNIKGLTNNFGKGINFNSSFSNMTDLSKVMMWTNIGLAVGMALMPAPNTEQIMMDMMKQMYEDIMKSLQDLSEQLNISVEELKAQLESLHTDILVLNEAAVSERSDILDYVKQINYSNFIQYKEMQKNFSVLKMNYKDSQNSKEITEFIGNCDFKELLKAFKIEKRNSILNRLSECLHKNYDIDGFMFSGNPYSFSLSQLANTDDISVLTDKWMSLVYSDGQLTYDFQNKGISRSHWFLYTLQQKSPPIERPDYVLWTKTVETLRDVNELANGLRVAQQINISENTKTLSNQFSLFNRNMIDAKKKNLALKFEVNKLRASGEVFLRFYDELKNDLAHNFVLPFLNRLKSEILRIKRANDYSEKVDAKFSYGNATFGDLISSNSAFDLPIFKTTDTNKNKTFNQLINDKDGIGICDGHNKVYASVGPKLALPSQFATKVLQSKELYFALKKAMHVSGNEKITVCYRPFWQTVKKVDEKFALKEWRDKDYVKQGLGLDYKIEKDQEIELSGKQTIPDDFPAYFDCDLVSSGKDRAASGLGQDFYFPGDGKSVYKCKKKVFLSFKDKKIPTETILYGDVAIQLRLQAQKKLLATAEVYNLGKSFSFIKGKINDDDWGLRENSEFEYLPSRAAEFPSRWKGISGKVNFKDNLSFEDVFNNSSAQVKEEIVGVETSKFDNSKTEFVTYKKAIAEDFKELQELRKKHLIEYMVAKSIDPQKVLSYWSLSGMYQQANLYTFGAEYSACGQLAELQSPLRGDFLLRAVEKIKKGESALTKMEKEAIDLVFLAGQEELEVHFEKLSEATINFIQNCGEFDNVPQRLKDNLNYLDSVR